MWFASASAPGSSHSRDRTAAPPPCVESTAAGHREHLTARVTPRRHGRARPAEQRVMVNADREDLRGVGSRDRRWGPPLGPAAGACDHLGHHFRSAVPRGVAHGAARVARTGPATARSSSRPRSPRGRTAAGTAIAASRFVDLRRTRPASPGASRSIAPASPLRTMLALSAATRAIAAEPQLRPAALAPMPVT